MEVALTTEDLSRLLEQNSPDSLERVEEFLSDEGIRIDFNPYNQMYRMETAFDKLHYPQVVGEWRPELKDALQNGVDHYEIHG